MLCSTTTARLCYASMNGFWASSTDSAILSPISPIIKLWSSSFSRECFSTLLMRTSEGYSEVEVILSSARFSFNKSPTLTFWATISKSTGSERMRACSSKWWVPLALVMAAGGVSNRETRMSFMISSRRG